MDDEIIYVPAGKYTTAGVIVEDAQEPGAHRFPSLMAFWIAAVSSVTPSLSWNLVFWVIQAFWD